jgi:predicted nucleotidyltransferase
MLRLSWESSYNAEMMSISKRRFITVDPAVEAWLRAAVNQLVRDLKPEKVIVFGSHVYGVPSADSDLDLLIVLPTRERSLAGRQRLVSRYFEPRRYPLDLVVLTPAEFARRLKDWFDPFLQEVVCQGWVLYERAPRGRARVGSEG